MNSRPKIRILQYTILVLCAITVIVCAFVLIRAVKGYKEASDFYDKTVISFDTQDTQSPDDGTDLAPEHITELMAAYRELQKQYPNVVGYINISAVAICYPVVQGNDNDYYTTHLISGEENKSGSIFLDFRVNPDPSRSKNLIVYGHNMNDRTMFHNVRNLFEEDIFRNAQVEYVCDAGVFIYDSLSVYVTDTSDVYHAYDFLDEETFARYFADRASVSRISAEYSTVSNLITLVTCSNSATNQDQRFIYHGKLIQSYTDIGDPS